MSAPAATKDALAAPVRTGPDYFLWVCGAASVGAIFVLGWIFFEIFQEALPALKEFGAKFLTNAT